MLFLSFLRPRSGGPEDIFFYQRALTTGHIYFKNSELFGWVDVTLVWQWVGSVHHGRSARHQHKQLSQSWSWVHISRVWVNYVARNRSSPGSGFAVLSLKFTSNLAAFFLICCLEHCPRSFTPPAPGAKLAMPGISNIYRAVERE